MQQAAVFAGPAAAGPVSNVFVPAFLALLVVYLAVRAFWWIGNQPAPVLDAVWLGEGLLKVALWVVPCVLITRLAFRESLAGAWRALGLHGSPARGYFFGLAATLPMAIVVVVGRSFSTSIDAIAGTVVLGPFAEEVLFRGFLFLTLRRLGWRLAPATLVSALAFAVAHSQAAAWLVAGGLFGLPDWLADDFWRAALSLLPFVGIGVLFAWITHRWDSLWPAIGLHAAINLWWELSSSTQEYASLTRAFLTPLPIAHAITVVLAMALTFRATRARRARVAHEVLLQS